MFVGCGIGFEHVACPHCYELIWLTVIYVDDEVSGFLEDELGCSECNSQFSLNWDVEEGALMACFIPESLWQTERHY